MSERSKEVEALIESYQEKYRQKVETCAQNKKQAEAREEVENKKAEQMAKDLIHELLREYSRLEFVDIDDFEAELWIEVPGLAAVSRYVIIARDCDDDNFYFVKDVYFPKNEKFRIHHYITRDGKTALVHDLADDLPTALAIAAELGDTKPEAEMEAKKQLEEAAGSAKTVPFVPDYGACPFFRGGCLGPNCALYDTGNSMCVFHTINMALLDIANK
jgi:hypothetical protein